MMIKGRRLVLLVTSLVLCAGAAVLLSVTTSATVAKPGTASSRRAVRAGAPAVDAGMALPGGATEARASGQVRLVLQHEPLTTAEAVPVMVINGRASAIYRSLCFVLERRTSHGWQAVRRSHGVPVACTIWAGVVQSAHSPPARAARALRRSAARQLSDHAVLPTRSETLAGYQQAHPSRSLRPAADHRAPRAEASAGYRGAAPGSPKTPRRGLVMHTRVWDPACGRHPIRRRPDLVRGPGVRVELVLPDRRAWPLHLPGMQRASGRKTANRLCAHARSGRRQRTGHGLRPLEALSASMAARTRHHRLAPLIDLSTRAVVALSPPGLGRAETATSRAHAGAPRSPRRASCGPRAAPRGHTPSRRARTRSNTSRGSRPDTMIRVPVVMEKAVQLARPSDSHPSQPLEVHGRRHQQQRIGRNTISQRRVRK